MLNVPSRLGTPLSCKVQIQPQCQTPQRAGAFAQPHLTAKNLFDRFLLIGIQRVLQLSQ